MLVSSSTWVQLNWGALDGSEAAHFGQCSKEIVPGECTW